jgi:hypothetical protein
MVKSPATADRPAFQVLEQVARELDLSVPPGDVRGVRHD